MAEITGIQWCNHSWSPWFGCSPVSPGCAHCYAESDNTRYKRNGDGTWGKGMPRVLSKGWRLPRLWNRAAAQRGQAETVFPSLCDPFDEEVPNEWRLKLWKLIGETQWLDWLLLTKRPENIRPFQQWMAGADDISIADFPRNVWLGVSVENQTLADKRIPILFSIPNVTIRFLSVEPLLAPVNLTRLLGGVDWVIAGGESGSYARPCNVSWIRSVVRQCRKANVPCFVKQLGKYVLDRNDAGFEGQEPNEWPIEVSQEDRIEFLSARNWQGDPVRVHLRDRKGGDLLEWPRDLRIREFPSIIA